MRFIVFVALIAACESGRSSDKAAITNSDKPPPAPVPVQPPAAAMDPLTQKYTSVNNLVIAHYPEDFAAKTVGKAVILLSKNLADGNDEVLSFMSVGEPISNELVEFDRVVHAAGVKTLNRYVETWKKTKTCLGFPGIEHEGTWVSEDNVTYVRRVCMLMHSGHGYESSFSYPQSHPELVAQLERIRDAAELN